MLSGRVVARLAGARVRGLVGYVYNRSVRPRARVARIKAHGSLVYFFLVESWRLPCVSGGGRRDSVVKMINVVVIIRWLPLLAKEKKV